MKIEKVNDQQIRCTLTKADLADRELKISEIAYGTEKAKNLFRDMMQQAALKFGFEAENIPLMIEAIPLNSECLVLIITKVEDPEELDTRFSRFAPSSDSEDNFDDEFSEDDGSVSHASAEVMDLFKKIRDEASNLISSMEKDNAPITKKDSEEKPQIVAKIFSFDSMSKLLSPAVALRGEYDDVNSLYKEPETGKYMLVLNKKHGTTEAFNKACNILSEYGKLEKLLPSSEFYFKEHFSVVIEDNAIQTLSKIS